MSDGDRPDPLAEAWLEHFERHAPRVRRFRRVMRALPHDPRCKFCHAPFEGARVACSA